MAYLLSSRFFVGFPHYDETYLNRSKSHQTQQPVFPYRVGFMGKNTLAGFDVTDVTEAVREGAVEILRWSHSICDASSFTERSPELLTRLELADKKFFRMLASGRKSEGNEGAEKRIPSVAPGD